MLSTTPLNTRRALLGAGLAALLAASAPALAHHGWSWANSEQMTLEGTIKTISMAPPHPSLQVTAQDGTLWQVDLGNPRQTANSGFTGDTAKPGDSITVLGNRNRDETKPHMKAVRITLAGQNYDMYPERIGSK
ncbi:hypothetical protein EV667_1273 [Ancylobacter aquaticus]|uniref:DUF5666 domain-containing protein n=1 Tax=Ancylobacter aquaticus TaxID=100 RepID=A0A4R1I708_ANCAQ|nr:DUF6152 family protein [Ancylobacter aquaticus]TCK31167.1 hypothetical protein EV667_1273 [Ancylobacter aquaticus]